MSAEPDEHGEVGRFELEFELGQAREEGARLRATITDQAQRMENHEENLRAECTLSRQLMKETEDLRAELVRSKVSEEEAWAKRRRFFHERNEEAARKITELEQALEEARAQVKERSGREQELLALVRRISQETPLPDEANELRGQVAKVVAEIGTLRATIAEQARRIEQLSRECEARLGVQQGLGQRVNTLEQALRDAQLFIDHQPTRRLDALADLFYRETGVMAPGKSVALEMAISQPPDDVRIDQYRRWIDRSLERIRLAIDTALAGGEG